VEVNETAHASDVPNPPTRGLGRAGPVALIALIIPIVGAILIPTVGVIAAPWLRGQGMLGLALLMAALLVLGAVAIAPTTSSSLIAGWTFGFALGLPAVAVGLVAGGVLCYLSAKRLGRARVADTFAAHPRWEVVRRALLEENRLKALWIVVLLRLSPVLPLGTTNVLLATTGVSIGIYALGTALGLTPRIALLVAAASRAERLDFNLSESWLMLGGGIVATGVCVLVMAIIGKHALERATRNSKA
jgi:uncharacterized membrane protein YdjX (TVP38/TMEM64 family)